MTTQTHKLLPSEPTQEMLDAERFASSLAYESHEVQAVEVYKAMWQAAPEVEPLSEDELDKLIDDSIVNGTIRSLCRAIEKAHGIGVE